MASPISLDVVLPERGPEDDSTAVAVGGPYKIDDMKFGTEVAVPIAIEVVSTKTDEVSWAEEDELLPFFEDVVSAALPRIGDPVATALELVRRPTEELAAVVVEYSTPVERLLENVLEV